MHERSQRSHGLRPDRSRTAKSGCATLRQFGCTEAKTQGPHPQILGGAPEKAKADPSPPSARTAAGFGMTPGGSERRRWAFIRTASDLVKRESSRGRGGCFGNTVSSLRKTAGCATCAVTAGAQPRVAVPPEPQIAGGRRWHCVRSRVKEVDSACSKTALVGLR
jgi:hypothetical protein